MENEVDFLPADKPKGFLHCNIITLDMHRETYPKYQKQPVYKIFAIFDSMTNNEKLLQKLFSEQSFLQTLKQKVTL